jgi:hypothetical protein
VVVSIWAGVRVRKKAWAWRIRSVMVAGAVLAIQVFIAAQMRSVGLSWGLVCHERVKEGLRVV